MQKLLKFSLNLTKGNLKNLILFEIAYKFIIIFIIIPIFNIFINNSLKTFKYSYVTLENLVSFLKNPITIFSIISMLIILAFFELLEVTTIILNYYISLHGKNIDVVQMFYIGINRTFYLIKKNKVSILLFSILILPLLNIFYLIIIITRFRVPNAIIESIYHSKIMLLLLLAVIIIFFIANLTTIFTIFYCVLEKKTFWKSLKCNFELLKNRYKQTFKYMVFWNLVFFIIITIIYIIILSIIIGCIVLLSKKNSGIAIFLSMYDWINITLLFFIVTFGTVIQYQFISKLYFKYLKIKQINLNPIPYNIPKFRLSKVGLNNIFIGLIIIFTILNCIYILDIFKNGNSVSAEMGIMTKVTSHRGNSAYAPENTIPAIESAIENLADFAEIDVQETKDGVVILLHDKNVLRTTGINKNIWDIEYKDLMKLDAGSWFSDEFIGTNIPTLEEVLKLCKGKIKLNIEVKNNGHGIALEEKVVNLIEENDFEDQCVITSVSYTVLKNIKQLNENLKTGYIMTAAYGNFYDREYVDFFSIKSTFVNENIIKKSHERGKEVHVWTVNSSSELEIMKNLMVDNIITDKPILAKEILYSPKSIKTFIGFMKMAMKGV